MKSKESEELIYSIKRLASSSPKRLSQEIFPVMPGIISKCSGTIPDSYPGIIFWLTRNKSAGVTILLNTFNYSTTIPKQFHTMGLFETLEYI